eukprot:2294795-Rhodomonas_salina.1
MLCDAMLCYAMRCYAMLCDAMLDAMRCYAASHSSHPAAILFPHPVHLAHPRLDSSSNSG